MAHERFRRFNTMGRWPNQVNHARILENDLKILRRSG